MNDQVDALLAEYQKRRARTAQLQQQLREITATATTARRTVKVTVGAQGDLVGIEFPTGGYKRMTPTELTDAILGAAAEAKGKALESVRELLQPEMSPTLANLVLGNADAMGSRSEDPPMPSAIREYIGSGRMYKQPEVGDDDE